MRLFVGIEFPAAVLAALANCRDGLRAQSRRGRFKRRENFHLTLKFLGEVPAANLAEITALLEDAASKVSPFSLSLDRLGRFGGGQPVRVVWLDMAGEIDCLRLLQREVEQAMVRAGFKPESRAWQPHITLAQDVEPTGALPWGERPLPDTVFAVAEFALILSEQQDKRRVYTPISHFQLAERKG